MTHNTSTRTNSPYRCINSSLHPGAALRHVHRLSLHAGALQCDNMVCTACKAVMHLAACSICRWSLHRQLHRNPLPHPFASSYRQQSLSLSNPLAGRGSNESVARQQVHVNKLELCWSLNRQRLLLRLQLAMPRHSTVGAPTG